MHSSTIDLVNKFNETLDFEFDYIPKIHPIHNDENVSEINSVLQYISNSLPIFTNSKHVPLLQSKNVTNLLKLPHIPQMSSINIMLIVLLIIVNAPIVIYVIFFFATKHFGNCLKHNKEAKTINETSQSDKQNSEKDNKMSEHNNKTVTQLDAHNKEITVNPNPELVNQNKKVTQGSVTFEQHNTDYNNPYPTITELKTNEALYD